MSGLREFGSKLLARFASLESGLENLPGLNKKFIYAMLIGYSSYVFIRLMEYVDPELAYIMDVAFYWIYFLVVLLICIIF